MALVSAPRKSAPSRNRLLAATSPSDLALLLPHLQPVAMPLLKDLERPNRRIETIYFMEAGIASVVAVRPDATKVEVGLIGDSRKTLQELMPLLKRNENRSFLGKMQNEA